MNLHSASGKQCSDQNNSDSCVKGNYKFEFRVRVIFEFLINRWVKFESFSASYEFQMTSQKDQCFQIVGLHVPSNLKDGQLYANFIHS